MEVTTAKLFNHQAESRRMKPRHRPRRRPKLLITWDVLEDYKAARRSELIRRGKPVPNSLELKPSEQRQETLRAG